METYLIFILLVAVVAAIGATIGDFLYYTAAAVCAVLFFAFIFKVARWDWTLEWRPYLLVFFVFLPLCLLSAMPSICLWNL